MLINSSLIVASIDAIFSFFWYSVKLSRLHIDQIRAENQCNVKFNANNVNKRRSMLEYARKFIIRVPENKIIKHKWTSGPLKNYDLIEIKRDESYVPE